MDYQSFNGVRPSIRIRILVVDDDYMSLNMAATTLRSLKYEVLTAKHPFEALSTLHLMKGGIDLVVSDYHMPDMNGVQLQKRILEEFKIPVIMMSVDSRKYIMVESLRGGSKVFVVKPVQVEKLENVWQYVVANNKGKSPWTTFEGGVDRVGSYLGFQDRTPVSFSISCNNKHSDQDDKNKNHKVIWTNALHTLFLQAINQIGLEKAVPKKILDIMKVPGLTRQHVASHLQKYRIFLKKVADRGLVKWNDPQKALNDAFELSMASNAQYHDMVLSLPPSQFARSQDSQSKFGSVISFGNNYSQYGATNGESSSSSHHYLNHGSTPSNSTLGRATYSSALQNSNNMGGGFEFKGFGSDSRNMFQSQQFGSAGRGTEIGFGSSSAKNLNSASWNGNPNTSCSIQNGLRIHGKENQFPTRLGLNSMVPNPNNRSFDNQIGHGMPAKEHELRTATGLRPMMSTNPNNMSFRVFENEPTRLGLNSMSPNPNNWCFDNQIGHGMLAKEHVFPTASGSTNPNNMSFRVLENEPTRLDVNSMSPNPNNRCFNNQIGHGMSAKENVFLTAPGLKPMMSTNPNNMSFRVLENEPTRLGVNSMSPNPNHSSNHTGMTMGGNEQLIPSRPGLSSSYNPDNGFDIRVDSTKGALVFENNKWMNPIESNTSGHGHGEPPSFNINVLNSTPTVTNNLQENCASNDIEVTPYVLDELDTTVLPPPPADMSQKPTLGDDGFDCLYDLDLSELLLPQGDGDFDMAIEYIAPPLNENPTTNESEDQNWDDDFIGSLLVDDGPYMEANEPSCCLQ